MNKILRMLLAVFILTLFQGALAVNAADSPFPDIEAYNLNADALTYLKGKGVIQGYPDGNYQPLNNINRAEFTKIIMEALHDNLTGGNCFPDVKDEWFAPYVCTAKNDKIIEGYPDGTFKPADEINFSEAAKIISNAFGVDVPKENQNEEWFKKFINALESEQAIPLSVDFFDEKITRDEMAEMIYRLDADVDNKPSRTYNEIIGEGFVKAESCAALLDRYENSGFRGGYGKGEVFMMEDSREALTAVPASAPVEGVEGVTAEKSAVQNMDGGSEDFSTTNIQVEGVDEADIIKNDGKYIYLIKGPTVRIVEAYPANNLKEIVSLTLGEEDESFYPSEMFVYGDRLVVIGSVSKQITYPTETFSDVIFPEYYFSSRTKAFILDISDRAKPSVERSVEIEGNYTTSRRIGDTMYMVLTQYPYVPYGFNERPVITEEIGNTFVPKMLDSAVGKEELIAPCGDIMILPKPSNFNFLITAAIPLNDKEKEVDRNVVVGSSENVYASSSNLYVSATDWSTGYYSQYSDQGTALYKFALGDGTIEFKTKGKVPGTVLNQFSMDESNGHLRIATTKNEFVMGSELHNNLYILDENLEQSGAIENIAPGEKIFSVRFMGNRAYMVTFKRVDPLFVIDVADPKNPKILGKLKIPGYSNYLHPYDENHIMGFGKEVDEDSELNQEDFVYYTAVQGMKIGMFDVTDVAQPKEMFKVVIGDHGSDSELLYNHKALLFDKEKELLSFPITVSEVPDEAQCTEQTYSTCSEQCHKVCVPSSCTYNNGLKTCTTDCDGENSCVPREYPYPKTVFDGAYVYTVNLKDGFKLRGTITHLDESQQADLEKNGYSDYQKSIQRIIYIGENLYSISRGMVKANDINSINELNAIELGGDTEGYPVIEPFIR